MLTIMTCVRNKISIRIIELAYIMFPVSEKRTNLLNVLITHFFIFYF